MQDISVLYLSRVCLLPGFGYRTHTHDYWHFSAVLSGRFDAPDPCPPRCSCVPAGNLNRGRRCLETAHCVNVMFLVHNKELFRRLEAFPFSSLSEEELHLPVLLDLVERTRTQSPSQDFVDFAFGYYLHLLLETPRHCPSLPECKPDLVQQALGYLEEHYMQPVRLDEVASHIGRTPQHTSHLISTATGLTVVEQLRRIRLRQACRLLAYSDLPMDRIISSCGFVSPSNFHKVFRQSMGTTPARYRTSHAVNDTFYLGEDAALDIPYDQPVFTYVPGAGKCIPWHTPRAYFNQHADGKP